MQNQRKPYQYLGDKESSLNLVLHNSFSELDSQLLNIVNSKTLSKTHEEKS